MLEIVYSLNSFEMFPDKHFTKHCHGIWHLQQSLFTYSVQNNRFHCDIFIMQLGFSLIHFPTTPLPTHFSKPSHIKDSYAVVRNNKERLGKAQQV